MNYSNIRQLAEKYDLILGSKSPRRFELLKEIDVNFKQLIPEIDESLLTGEKPSCYAVRLAVEKAESLMPQISAGQLIIGCDTVVVLNDRIMDKPADRKDAFKILKFLSGKQHVVMTAIAITNHKKLLKSGYESTRVFFNNTSDNEITDYIQSGEPMDKAGAYGIQGMGAFLVDRIEGNLDNVIGFPRALLEKLAGELLKDSSKKNNQYE